MNNQVEFVRLVGTERRVGPTLQSVSRHWQGQEECFLFVSPHDDDALIGAGLMMQLAQKENVPVYVLVVTDGAMGYCSLEEKDSISNVRKVETYASYESLGIPANRIIWADFPDCQLNLYRGRKPAFKDKTDIAGFTGLQNTFTYFIRNIHPTQVFVATSNDLHPDHRIVNEELLISLFHAGGEIWPELGKPLGQVPYIHEYGVYCDFPVPPQLQIKTPEVYLEKKLHAIEEFKSQKQIGSVVEIVRKSGAEEYFRSVEFRLYQPKAYRDRFSKPDDMPILR